MLKICGAKLHLVEAVPYKNPKNYLRYSETLSKKIKTKMVFYGIINLIIYQIKKHIILQLVLKSGVNCQEK